MTLANFLIVSVLVLIAGILTVIIKRNAVGILMGIELILSAAMVNFVAFNAYLPPGRDGPRIDGKVFALFILVLAACQAAVAIAVFINLYQVTGSIDVEETAPVTETPGGGGLSRRIP
jgi:NADH-quinone oxidoreductase subunit K